MNTGVVYCCDYIVNVCCVPRRVLGYDEHAM